MLAIPVDLEAVPLFVGLQKAICAPSPTKR